MRGSCVLRKPYGGTFAILFLISAISIVSCHQEFANQKWTKEFAVEMEKTDPTEAELIVSVHGFRMIRSIPSLNVHHLHHDKACSSSHRCKRHAEDLVSLLRKSPHVKRAQQLYILERDMRRSEWSFKDFDRDAIDEEELTEKRDEEYRKNVISRHERLKYNYNDPLFKRQWHLDNYGQITNAGLDLNLLPAWRKGYHGQGSRVTVVDDGVDTGHDDLKHAYDPYLSADLNDPTDIHGNPHDPTEFQAPVNGHGTSCAGEIAAMPNNNKCGCGVAPKVKLGGIRMLAGKVTDLTEAFGVLHMHNVTEVYSCSWGPSDNGKLMDMPHHYTGMGLKISTTRGRNGLGNIFSFASGNGGAHGDNCGADGYVNSPYTFPMAAVNIYGRTVYYGERCSAIMAAVPVGGRTAGDGYPPEEEANARVITDSINNGCRLGFMGTSAAAPLGAACYTLILQANRLLTWRDVQHIVAHSTRVPNPKERVWQTNGAGIHVSHHFGFGLLDCSTAVKNAQTWVNVGPQESCSVEIHKGKDKIFAGRGRRYTLNLQNCSSGNSSVGSIEHVTVTARIDHVLRGDLSIWLISPAGTISRLLGERWPDKSKAGIKFTFLTRYLLGESPKGKWTIEVQDSGRRRTKGRVRGAVKTLNLTIHGTEKPSAKMAGVKLRKAKRLSAEEVREMYVKGRKRALNVYPEHHDVLEIKRKFTNGSLDKTALKQVLHLSNNPEVSSDEIRNLIDFVKKRLKKKTTVKKGAEAESSDDEE